MTVHPDIEVMSGNGRVLLRMGSVRDVHRQGRKRYLKADKEGHFRDLQGGAGQNNYALCLALLVTACQSTGPRYAAPRSEPKNSP